MLDVLELEARWSKYHFKKVLPLYILSVAVVAVLVAVPSYIYVTNPELITTYFSKDRSTEKVENIPVVAVKKNAVKKSEVTDTRQQAVIFEQNTLTPSLTFLSQLDDKLVIENNRLKLAAIAALRPAVKKVPTKSKVKKKKVKKAAKKPKPKQVAKKSSVAVVKPAKTVTAPSKTKVTVLGDNNKKSTVQTKSVQVGHNNTSKSQLNSVIKRFNKSKKPALGLFISNTYYEQGNYKESYKYARQTYKINPNIEDAVLLYAKSLAKLGKKELAMSKLRPYIKKSSSVKAKALLSQIKKGTF